MPIPTLSREEVIRLRERKRPKRVRQRAESFRDQVWDQTIAKATELASPDGRLNLAALADALGVTRAAVWNRSRQIIAARGPRAWPWHSPRGTAAYQQPAAEPEPTAVEQPPTESSPAPAPPEVPATVSTPPPAAIAPGGPQCPPDDSPLRLAVLSYLRAWKALRASWTVYGPAEREADLARQGERRAAV